MTWFNWKLTPLFKRRFRTWKSSWFQVPAGGVILLTENTVIAPKSLTSSYQKKKKVGPAGQQLQKSVHSNWNSPSNNRRFLVFVVKQFLERKTKQTWIWYTVLYLSKVILWSNFWICSTTYQSKNAFWDHFSGSIFCFRGPLQKKTALVGGWTTHFTNMLVKLEHFHRDRSENWKKCLKPPPTWRIIPVSGQ